MSRKFLSHAVTLLAVAGLLIACTTSSSSPDVTTSSLPLTDCVLSAPGGIARVEAECGTLAVPENPGDPDGKQINLNVAVVPAVNRNKEPDPLFIFAGGPGQAATETYVTLRSAFGEINRSRDIVLIDQRGTGKSNALRCESPDDVDITQNMTPEELDAYQLEQLGTCLANLPGDPRYYTTTFSVNDFDAVREALGYQTINIYGVSYGTRTALTYLKLYPDRVRAAILDGVVPQDTALGLDVARDAQHALDLIFSRCAADTDCQTAFPNARSEFETLMQQLEATPVEVTLPHPTTGEQITVTLDSATVAITIRLLSYTAETVALVPLFIHAASEGDYVPITAQSLVTSNDLAQSISGGLNASVLCAEDAPFITPEAAEAANAETYLGDLQTRQLALMCGVWPHGPIADDFKSPVTSDVPVLLLSGEADPVTPPTNGDKAAQTLSNSLHLVAPGQGHNVIFRGCIPNLAADFIESGSVQGLETACVNDIKPMPFFVDFTGTKP